MDWHVSDAAQAAVDMGARAFVDSARQALAEPPLNLPAESVKDGTIITGWRQYPGELHIVRRWYERTRFRILVTPDFNDPSGRCTVRVEDQTQERATEAQPWYPAPDRRRPERSSQVLHQLLAQVRQSSATSQK